MSYCVKAMGEGKFQVAERGSYEAAASMPVIWHILSSCSSVGAAAGRIDINTGMDEAANTDPSNNLETENWPRHVCHLAP